MNMHLFFFTVLGLLIAGLTLAAPFVGRQIAGFKPFEEILLRPLLRAVLGIITGIVGLFNLLDWSQQYLLLNNLLPAGMALIMGTMLFSEYLQEVHSIEHRFFERLKPLFRIKTFIGLLAIIIALLHLIMPTAVIL